MDVKLARVVSGCLLVSGLAVACSSQPAQQLQPGTVPAGTAEVTVNGQKLATSEAVDCSFIQSSMTIMTGDDASGATIVIDNSLQLDTKSVEIRELGGFTGSYRQDLGGTAAAKLVGRTFTIEGTADGFDATDPSARTTGSFSVMASC